VLSESLDGEDVKTITDMAGFAHLTVAGYLIGVRANSFPNDALLILITPRRVAAPIRDSRTLYAGRGEASGRAGAGVTPVAPVPEPGQPAPAGEPPPPEPAPGPPPTAPAPPQVPPPQQPAP